MFIIKCSNCGFEITDWKKAQFYGGTEKVMASIVSRGSAVEKRRQLANLFNREGIPCLKCRKTDIWTWV
ncbi:hypothetical protein [Persephonella sp.]